MHELAVTRAMLDQVLDEAQRRSARRVLHISLVVGEAASVVPDCVRFYFDILSEGTIAQGAEISFQRTPIRIRCPKCGREAAGIEDLCGCNAGGEVISGTEMVIESIDIE
ncbi:MAG: hydrogenase maturation nickel metallochaperone HypA [candidate division WOR-3 bacterium]